MIIWGKATSFQPLLVKFGELFVSPVSRTVSDTFLLSTRFPVHGILVCHQEQTMTGHKILVPRTLLWWRNGKGRAWLSVIHFHFPPRVVRDTQVSYVNKLFNHMSTTFSSSYKYVSSPRLLYSFLSFLSFYFCVYLEYMSQCVSLHIYIHEEGRTRREVSFFITLGGRLSHQTRSLALLSTLDGHQVLWICMPSPWDVGVTGTSNYLWLFIWVLGIWTKSLMFQEQAVLPSWVIISAAHSNFS